MGCRKWVRAVLLLAAWVEASGQNPGQAQIDKSAERVVFFTGSVMLDDGSPPADSVRIERVCNGRTSFETWTDVKGHFGFKVSSSGRSFQGTVPRASAWPSRALWTMPA
jgi:hypothetical protein